MTTDEALDWADSGYMSPMVAPALARAVRELRERIDYRGKVTRGVFCEGCADWEQMAFDACTRAEAVEARSKELQDRLVIIMTDYNIANKNITDLRQQLTNLRECYDCPHVGKYKEQLEVARDALTAIVRYEAITDAGIVAKQALDTINDKE